MVGRINLAIFSLVCLALVGCDNEDEAVRQTASKHAPPVSSPIAEKREPAHPPADALAKPPGVDPDKLAENAKALSALGYQSEADILYGHACDWGNAAACAHLSMAKRSAAPSAAPAAARPQATTTTTAKENPPLVVKPASVARVEQSPASRPPAPVPPSARLSTPTPGASAQAPLQAAPAATASAQAALPAASSVQGSAKLAMMQDTRSSPATASDRPGNSAPRKLVRQAQDLEQIGYAPMAIRLYKDACLAGDGLSCKRLGEIYIKGTEGVGRDYAESVQWYNRARQLGVAVHTLEKRVVVR